MFLVPGGERPRQPAAAADGVGGDEGPAAGAHRRSGQRGWGPTKDARATAVRPLCQVAAQHSREHHRAPGEGVLCMNHHVPCPRTPFRGCPAPGACGPLPPPEGPLAHERYACIPPCPPHGVRPTNHTSQSWLEKQQLPGSSASLDKASYAQVWPAPAAAHVTAWASLCPADVLTAPSPPAAA